jgi:hypothetical protein
MRRALGVLLALVLVSALGTPAARAAEPVVPASYFAAHFNFARYSFDAAGGERISQALGKLRAAGIENVRGTFSWKEMEPNGPTDGKHNYVFVNFDRWVLAAARQGVRIQANFGYAPRWASDSPWCESQGAYSPRPTDLHSWTKAVQAFARRYGRGGTLWAQNPGVSPRPITMYEIWNEQNLNWYWCPAPQPEVYGRFLGAAEWVIHAVDSNARVIMGGMPFADLRDPDTADQPGEFVARVFNHVPSLRNLIDGIGIHPYAFGARERQLAVIARFRNELRANDVPDSMPMFATEVGWPSRGTPSYPEEERAERYRLAATELPRTNCNLLGMTAFEWVAREQNPDVWWDWMGMARPANGDLYPSGQSYGSAVRLMRGELSSEPPREPLAVC